MCAMPVYLNIANRLNRLLISVFKRILKTVGCVFYIIYSVFTVAVLSGGFCKRKKLV